MLGVVELITDNVPAWLTLIGALSVAIIAAVTASRRQAAQLDHDRQLHDLGELRGVLDEAAATAYSFHVELRWAQSAAQVWAEHQSDAEVKREVRKRVNDLLEGRGQLDAIAARIALRRGHLDDTYAAFAALIYQLRQGVGLLPIERPPGDDELARLDAALGLVPGLRDDFIRSAHRTVGSQIEPRTRQPWYRRLRPWARVGSSARIRPQQARTDPSQLGAREGSNGPEPQ